MREYVSRERGLRRLMDGGIPTSFTDVLYRPPTYHMGDNQTVLERFAIRQARFQNRSSQTIACGIGTRLDRSRWHAGQWDGSTYTDDTDDAQDTGTSDFPLETVSGNGSGFLVSAVDRFNVLCLLIGTASVGGTPGRRVRYSLADGTWQPLTNLLVGPVTGGHWVAQETLIWWVIPPDWAPMVAGHGNNVRVGEYGVVIEATTAPSSTAGSATSMSVAQVVWARAGVSDDAEVAQPMENEYVPDCLGDAVVAVVSDVTDPQTICTALVKCRG